MELKNQGRKEGRKRSTRFLQNPHIGSLPTAGGVRETAGSCEKPSRRHILFGLPSRAGEKHKQGGKPRRKVSKRGRRCGASEISPGALSASQIGKEIEEVVPKPRGDEADPFGNPPPRDAETPTHSGNVYLLCTRLYAISAPPDTLGQGSTKLRQFITDESRLSALGDSQPKNTVPRGRRRQVRPIHRQPTRGHFARRSSVSGAPTCRPTGRTASQPTTRSRHARACSFHEALQKQKVLRLRGRRDASPVRGGRFIRHSSEREALVRRHVPGNKVPCTSLRHSGSGNDAQVPTTGAAAPSSSSSHDRRGWCYRASAEGHS